MRLFSEIQKEVMAKNDEDKKILYQIKMREWLEPEDETKPLIQRLYSPKLVNDLLILE